MPLAPVRGVGVKGIVKDISSVLLPSDTWSDGLNVRFDDGSVHAISGHTEMFTTSAEPQFLLYWPRPVTPFYIYADAADPTRVDAAGNTASIKPSATTYSTSGVWQGTLFNGGYTVVMNNTVDEPVYINYGTSGATTETELTTLPGWPTDLSAGVIRSHRNVLIAGNLADSSGAFTNFMAGTIRISSQAAPGAVPASWTVGDGNTTADEFELSTGETILEIVDLRGYVLVFTGNSIHQIKIPTSTTAATQVQNLNYGRGVLGTNCAIELDGSVFAVDRNDIYVTGGTGGIQSVADGKVRKDFFNSLNNSFADRVFVTRNIPQDEVWICYPTTASTDGRCDMALIWNYIENHWTFREMPATRFATQGPTSNGTTFDQADEHIIFTGQAGGTSGDSTSIHIGDSGTTFDGDAINSYVEKTRFDMQEIDATKWTGSVYPVMTGDNSVTWTFLPTNVAGDSPDLSVYHKNRRESDFSIQSDYKIDPKVNGRFLSFRVAGEGAWTLDGYTLSVDAEDRR